MAGSRPASAGPLSEAVTRYVVALGAAGVGLVVAALTLAPTSRLSMAGVAALLGLSVLSVFLPVRFFHGQGEQGFNLEGAVFIALLLAAGPGVAVAGAAASALLAFSIRSRDPWKVLFNSGQNAVWAASGAAVFTLVGPGAGLLNGRTVLAVTAASLAMIAVNGLLLAELVHRLQGRARGDALRDALPLLIATVVGNGTAGYVLALLVEASIWAVVPGALLLLGLHVGYRGHIRSLASRRRAERLSGLTRRLLEAGQSRHALEDFLDDLARALGATGAELLILRDGEEHVSTTGDVPPSAPGTPACDELLQSMREGSPVRSGATPRQCIAAPLLQQGTAIGGIALLGRHGAEPWDDGDMHLLAAVANEAAVALRNVELIGELELERARLEAETTKLGDIVDAASDGIVLFGRDGRIQAWNRAMTEITGTPAEEVRGHPWFVSLRLKDAVDNELLPEADHVIADAIAGHRHRDAVSLQVLRRDGVWRWLRVTFAPVLRGDAEPVGTVMVARDVTSEREVEDLKNDFVATVSHELRTPLTPLKGFLSTLEHRGYSMTPDQLEIVFDAMRSQVDRLEHLIADLLVIADLDRGAVTLARANVDVADVAATVVAQEDDGRVVLETAEPVSALGDEAAVRRVVSALVSNALKHTDGRVIVRVEAEDGAARVHVIDEGSGIAPWEQERIFNRFHRLGDHLTRTQGPGLGLPIARALAQRMAGDIAVSSDVGHGSRFTLTLPIARPRVVPDEDQARAG